MQIVCYWVKLLDVLLLLLADVKAWSHCTDETVAEIFAKCSDNWDDLGFCKARWDACHVCNAVCWLQHTHILCKFQHSHCYYCTTSDMSIQTGNYLYYNSSFCQPGMGWHCVKHHRGGSVARSAVWKAGLFSSPGTCTTIAFTRVILIIARLLVLLLCGNMLQSDGRSSWVVVTAVKLLMRNRRAVIGFLVLHD